MARKSKWDEYVEPRLGDVEKWARAGVEEQRICKALGVSVQTWSVYKHQHPELVEALKSGRQEALAELDAALFKRACGYDYEESDTYIRQEGKSYVVKHKRHQAPDVAAIHLLKKNWDKENWTDNPVNTDIKRAELELKQKLADDKDWVGLCALG